MEQRALLAFILSVAILIGYQAFFAPAPPVPQQQGQLSAPPPPSAVDPAASPAAEALSALAESETQTGAIAPPPEPAEERAGEVLVEVENKRFIATFSSHGGRLKSFRLKSYRESPGPDAPALDMVSAGPLYPLGLYWSTADGGYAGDASLDYEVKVERGDEMRVVMTAVGPAGERIRKILTLDPSAYVLRYEAEVADAGNPGIGVSWVRRVPEDASRFAGIDGPAAFIGDELHTEASASMDEPMKLTGPVDWAGYAEHYFLAAYYPDEARPLRFLGASNDRLGEATLFDDEAGGRVVYNLFVGPKKVWLLGSLGHRLDEALNLGWFAIVARPLLELMLYLTKFTGNYGWSIILLTIGIRIVFYPVNQRQASAMKAMQRIQPELKKIQEKYKDDREKLNKEMMEVYRRHKVNPLAGCLPMLMQLPVFLGLYNALMQSIELRHAHFLGWITDLSQPDRLGSLAIPFVSPPGIPVMTLLMGASMIIQQRMMPAQGDPVQQRMMMLLPVVFTVMFVNFPSGLVLYWFANNIMSIGQQYMTNRAKA